MAETFILAVDHGTSGMKTALVDSRGNVVDSAFRETPIHFTPDGGAEQDPDDWWNALLETATEVVGQKTVPPEEIEAIGISSTFSTTVAVDRNGNHLMNALTWMDSRGAPHIQARISGFPEINGINLFKALRWVRKTAGAPSPSGKDDIAHVLLTRTRFPEIYEQTALFLPSKDYLNLRLTGKAASSFDAMHLFWVTDSRNVNRMDYDTGLLKMAGLERDKLPVCNSQQRSWGPCCRKSRIRSVSVGVHQS